MGGPFCSDRRLRAFGRFVVRLPPITHHLHIHGPGPTFRSVRGPLRRSRRKVIPNVTSRPSAVFVGRRPMLACRYCGRPARGLPPATLLCNAPPGDGQAEARPAAEAAVDSFAEKYGAKYEKAVTCLTKDRAAAAFYDVPADHWGHMRISNLSKTCSPRSVIAPSAPRAPRQNRRLIVFNLRGAFHGAGPKYAGCGIWGSRRGEIGDTTAHPPPRP